MLQRMMLLIRGRKADPSPGRLAAEEALADARRARRDIEARRPAVLAVVATLRRAREENHFAERIEAAFRGAAR